jgi:hypothetical protein
MVVIPEVLLSSSGASSLYLLVASSEAFAISYCKKLTRTSINMNEKVMASLEHY